MRIYNRYIFSMTLAFTLTTVLLAVSREGHLDLYFSLYVIESLVLTSLFVYLSPKAMKGLNVVWYMLFGGFTVVVGLRVADILFGIRL